MKAWVKAILILPFNVVVVIPFLILYFSDYVYTAPGIWQNVLGCVLLAGGLFLAVWTMLLFHKIGKGTLAPWKATTHLVTEGPFKYTRNPMITGVLAILTAEAFLLNEIYVFYWMIIFFLINCVYFKLFEEKQLEKKFGEEYLAYKKNVPMWLPASDVKNNK